MAKVVAVRGLCPGCGHVFEGETENPSHRRIVECPACREHKIIAREVKASLPPKETGAPSGRPKRQSSVRKVSYAPRPKAAKSKATAPAEAPEGTKQAIHTRGHDGRFAIRQSTDRRSILGRKTSVKPSAETPADLCDGVPCSKHSHGVPVYPYIY